MDYFTENDDNIECQFFDVRDDTVSLASSISDSGSDYGDSFEVDSKINNWGSSQSSYNMWIRSPESVQERRSKFLSLYDWSSDSDALERDLDRITKNSGAVLRDSVSGDEFSSTNSSISSQSNVVSDMSDPLGFSDDCEIKIGNSCIECEPNVDDLRTNEEEINHAGTKKKVKKGWLSKLRTLRGILDKEGNNSVSSGMSKRVRVHQNNKKLKELSALYVGQDIQAHEGSISTMKFSHDGQYLASAGEDGNVRVWQVVENDLSSKTDILDIDSSSMYFTVNLLSELTPLCVDQEKLFSKLNGSRKSSDSACVIFPPKVFRILEKPLHEFHGHNGEILDLTWSKNNCLLSASVDKTVRMWRVGCDHCLKVFLHTDYVTCVQFNPIDEDYFMSGSIDGKARIWDIPNCQVVDWTDIKDIVTAVCYQPDAQGGIIGSMRGNCHFFNISDNHLKMDYQISVQSKKKSSSKRITGFQFLSQDSSKVMVTCADSQVRILDGAKVIGKYKGRRNGSNSIHASFTSNGKHIISACEDSNVYIWNHINSENPALTQTKNIRSYERFSGNASIAIPWSGMKHETLENNTWKIRVSKENSLSPKCFSLSHEFCVDSSFYRGFATWPEEKLPISNHIDSSFSSIRKSQYKFLKSSCQSTSNSHAWGLVIVTAGYDGRIRSFHNYGLPVPT